MEKRIRIVITQITILAVLEMALLLARKAYGEVSVFTEGNQTYLVNFGFPSEKALGIRVCAKKDITYYGLKFQLPIKRFSSKNLKIFCGAEADYITHFTGEASKGNGFIGHLSIGAICQVKRLCLMAEIGPAIITLKDKSYRIRVTEIDPAAYRVGFGFRFY